MHIDVPLLDIEIIGTAETSILKINRETLASKGSREYCLSVREELLANRGFSKPEDWDMKWNSHTLSTWTPSKLSGLTCHLDTDSYSLSADSNNA